MKYYEWGNQNKKTILLLPGTCCGEKIKADGTTVHIFYALQMGEKYRDRYLLHFANPDIIEQNYGHEELLFFYPEEWVKAIINCCEKG